MPIRKASARWEGGLKGGKGTFEGESGRLEGGYDFGSRFADAGGTNPEELLGAAHAACFSMALAAGLEKNGTPATSVSTRAGVTIQQVEGGFGITSIALTSEATVAGIDDAKFQEIARATKEGCPVSKALDAVDITLTATLQPG